MAPTSADSVNPDHMNFILNVVSHVEDFKVDWNAVAEDNGIGYARNASSKFKDTVKKYGYKYEASKVIMIDENGDETQAAAAPKTPGKRTNKKGGAKTTRPAKKQKVAQKVPQLADDDGEEKAVRKDVVKIDNELVFDGNDKGVQA